MILITSYGLYNALKYRDDVRFRGRYAICNSDPYCIYKDYNAIAIISHSKYETRIYLLHGQSQITGNICSSNIFVILTTDVSYSIIDGNTQRASVNIWTYQKLGYLPTSHERTFNFALKRNKIYFDNMLVFNFKSFNSRYSYSGAHIRKIVKNE